MNIVAVLNGSTVTQFVDNKDAFDNCVDEYFQVLDVGHNGKLSRNPPQEIGHVYDTVFERFDENGDGNIDRSQFGALMREIMLAMARGIGNSLVLMALEQDSLLRKAVEHESASKK
ncbi:hypothetical protein Patl1_23355 [Pistacia atlantica]|uniref:Uncharacterized protein n=1 Tax=Pistacia atlantica TaxID=434234 RepID=A0ACC0ZXZ2_9ROSI|nr:hypothetical protein Patl1_23355 [Pistacia atlantica]